MPALDQTTFEQMLEAAFILQQQNKSQKKLDPAATLVEIAEAQELLRSLPDMSAAARVIVERLEKITSATAIAVAFLRNDRLEYCAAAGTLSSLAGSIVPIPQNVAELLRKDKERQPSSNDVRREHLQGDTPNPILFPFYDKTTMSGFLQLSFPDTELVAAHQMQSCHVMANLMGESVVRAAELQWKQTLAKEHAALLEALERLKPQLERLTTDLPMTADVAPMKLEPSPAPVIEAREKSAAELSPEGLPDISNLLEQLTVQPGPANANQNMPASVEQKDEPQVLATVAPEVTTSQPAAIGGSNGSAADAQLSLACGQCGFLFSEGESFCGRCGTPRAVELLSAAQTAQEPSRDPQPTPKFLLTGETTPAVFEPTPVMSDLASAQALSAVDGCAALAIESKPSEAETEETEEAEPNSQLRILLEQENSAWETSPWTSATKARTWLESVKNAHGSKRWLGRHQGDISVTISVLVLLLAVLWWSPHQVPSRPRAKAPEPSLTLFERALVGLGLAQPPAVAPSYGGNPSLPVWEDVHTALYYCSGSEQYGKTPGGKIAAQHEAQLDQFEPATRKPCE